MPSPRASAVEHLGAALATAGLPRLPARTYAALLADEDGRMTAAEIADELSVSPAAVSGAVRYLMQVHFLRRERVPGSRRDVYVVQDDAFHDVLLQKDQIYAPLLSALAQVAGALPREGRAAARVGLSREFLEFIQREMDAVALRWEAHLAERGRGAGPTA